MSLSVSQQYITVDPRASMEVFDDDDDDTVISIQGLVEIPIDSTMVVDASVLVGASHDDFWLSPLPHESSDATVVSTAEQSLVHTGFSSSTLSLVTMASSSTSRHNDDPTFNPVFVSQKAVPNEGVVHQHIPDNVMSLFPHTFANDVPHPTPLSPLHPMLGMGGDFHPIAAPPPPQMSAPSAVLFGAANFQRHPYPPWFAMQNIHPSAMIPVVSMQAPGQLTSSADGALLTAQTMMPSHDPPSEANISNILIPPIVTSRTKANDSLRGQHQNVATSSTGDGIDVANRRGRKLDRASSKDSSTKRKAECDLQPPPVRALTAYNYFFRFERDRLLKFCAEQGKGKNLDALLDGEMPPEYFEHYSLTPDNSADFQEELLRDQWSRDHTIKRKHSKSHGKISFRCLSKRIAQGWKALPQSVKNVFRDIATKDFDRYKCDMAERG